MNKRNVIYGLVFSCLLFVFVTLSCQAFGHFRAQAQGATAIKLNTALISTSALIFTQAKAPAAEVKLTDEQIKAGTGLDEQIKQSQQVLNAVLSQAVQSNFDTQSALEVLGRIQTAYLRSEYLKLQKVNWEKDMQIAHGCGGCVIDLAAKVMRKKPQENAQRE